ncbi:MAG: PAS domain-containing protein [Kiritimatiellaeota bacterium]|nr:PAS domain-containing protein [Kiritimatiellota bacterium]
MTKKTNFSLNEKGDSSVFLSKLPFPCHSLDASCRILEVNDPWLRALGFNEEEVVGKKLTRFMDEDSRPDFEENFKTLIRSAGTFSGQMELIDKKGHPVQFLVDGILEKSDGGDFIRNRCFLRDISSTCNAETELQRLSARNSAILGAIPEILMEVDEREPRVHMGERNRIRLFRAECSRDEGG